MALRKAAAYSKKYTRPYTRKSKKKNKSYIKTVPQHKIVKFKMGDLKGYDKGKYHFLLRVKADENVLIRDNALEAVRQYVNKQLDKALPAMYYFEVKPFPHHILRENKMLTGAGSDRMQTGMQLSFGKAMGRAAMVKAGQEIITIGTFNLKSMQTARTIINKVKSKFPCKVHSEFEKVEKAV